MHLAEPLVKTDEKWDIRPRRPRCFLCMLFKMCIQQTLAFCVHTLLVGPQICSVKAGEETDCQFKQILHQIRTKPCHSPSKKCPGTHLTWLPRYRNCPTPPSHASSWAKCGQSEETPKPQGSLSLYELSGFVSKQTFWKMLWRGTPGSFQAESVQREIHVLSTSQLRKPSEDVHVTGLFAFQKPNVQTLELSSAAVTPKPMKPPRRIQMAAYLRDLLDGEAAVYCNLNLELKTNQEPSW